MRLVALVDVHDHGRQAFQRPGGRERPAVDRTAGGDPPRELEDERLRVRVVAADERVLLGRRVSAEVARREGVQACNDRGADDGLDARGHGCRVGRRQHPVRPEGQLGGDREDRRPPDRLAQPGGGRHRRLGLRRQDHQVRGAAGVGVRRAFDPHGRRGRRRPLRVARADDDVVPRLGEALRKRQAEASGAPYDRNPHATASSTTSASLRPASRSVISVSVTTSGTSVSAGASARSITSAPITPS